MWSHSGCLEKNASSAVSFVVSSGTPAALLPTCATAALTLSLDRDATVTFAPAAAAALAVANPIPELPPNTSTRASFNERPIRFSCGPEYYNGATVAKVRACEGASDGAMCDGAVVRWCE